MTINLCRDCYFCRRIQVRVAYIYCARHKEIYRGRGCGCSSYTKRWRKG